MKRLLSFVAIIIMSLLSLPVSAGVNDFHFSNYEADYYLIKDNEGKSHLSVTESVTAVFPNFNQNKGICRQIPFTNQNGNNLTLPKLNQHNLTLTRNGVPEPIYSIDKKKNYYEVCTGTEEYVLGEQTYTFAYSFVNVVTQFDGYQELYWDTNGNGAMQTFDKVTARVHFEDPSVWSNRSWCYVGRFGSNDQNRCTITEINDGVQFEAENLEPYEGLTFDTELRDGSFTIPEPPLNYTYVKMIVALGAILLAVLIGQIVLFIKNAEKMKYYRGLFVKPEYQPNKDYSLPEMAEVYFGKKKDANVAMLLELVVNKNIEFKKNENKKWFVVVKDLSGVEREYINLLSILKGGSKPEVGDEIEIKRRTATSRLVSLKDGMEAIVEANLKKDELVEKNYYYGSSKHRGILNIVVSCIIAVPLVFAMWLMVVSIVEESTDLLESYSGVLVFEDEIIPVSFWMITITVIVSVILNNTWQKYATHTKKGLEAVRYMDGLKTYISMAEADRLKMLQSVEGADTSSEGIVKLYEKLLPFAAVFGLEESWIKEMKQYCEVEEIEQPDYLLHGITISELSRGLSTASSSISSSSTMSSSGGSSSSGFSGGGGGGFSGGGGGGGGFSGR